MGKGTWHFVPSQWNSVDAGPVLLDLATAAPGEKYQIRALRGYISLARRFTMPERQRAEMCRQALDVSGRSAEQELVFDVLELHASVEGLELTISATRNAGLQHRATRAAMAIAQKLGSKGVDVTDVLADAGLAKITLQIVRAEYGAGTTQKDVSAVLRTHARDLPWISLPASYNASFGGDPVAGVPKRLRIQYRINGTSGEASFAENAPIMLPMPK